MFGQLCQRLSVRGEDRAHSPGAMGFREREASEAENFTSVEESQGAAR